MFQTARTGQILQNITGAERTPLPDAIWMPVPSIFILMNPLGTSPARDMISQIPTEKVLFGITPFLIHANLSSTNGAGILTPKRFRTPHSLLHSI